MLDNDDISIVWEAWIGTQGTQCPGEVYLLIAGGVRGYPQSTLSRYLRHTQFDIQQMEL